MKVFDMLEIARIWTAFRNDKRGVTAVEYGILASLIVVGLIATMPTLMNGIKAGFTMVAGHLASGT